MRCSTCFDSFAEDRICVDPGIGFGKSPLQSLKLLRHIRRFERYGLRCLVGHSRKSFMQAFAGSDMWERDLFTLGASLAQSASSSQRIGTTTIACGGASPSAEEIKM